MADSDSSGWGWAIAALILVGVCFASKNEPQTGEAQKGDLSMDGGSPTIRREFEPRLDDPYTTNDESNDQPVGYFGTKTLLIGGQNGNTYTLDGELEGLELRRVYFPRGGWVDFPSCELESDLSGFCIDEEGRSWTVHGEASGYTSADVAEEVDEEEVVEEGSDDEDGDDESSNDQ